MTVRGVRLFYGATVYCGSALLFLIQPIATKTLLPLFGGSAGVWVTSMLFFQFVLMLGYAYANAIVKLPHRWQALLHTLLLTFGCYWIWKISWRVRFETAHTNDPTSSILLYLTLFIGLPYFLLSATSPLLQSWYAKTPGVQFPFKLFGFSNAFSLFALLTYPILLEPNWSSHQQLHEWMGAFVLFLILASVSVMYSLTVRHAPQATDDSLAPAKWVSLTWIGFAACASILWIGIANYLSQKVTPIPFVWILPLSLYLLSFVLTFNTNKIYRPSLFRWILPMAWLVLCWRLAAADSVLPLAWEVGLFSVVLLSCCVFCHGELARTKPIGRESVARFYLMISVGGALGAVFAGLFAPQVFNLYLEVPIGIMMCVLLALAFLYKFQRRYLVRWSLLAVCALIVSVGTSSFGKRIYRVRNFYGTLEVRDSGTGETTVRSLYSAGTLHGIEWLSPQMESLPTAYYGSDSGVGVLLRSYVVPGRRVAVVGLGAGTLAIYGRNGDYFRFYEINPAVVRIASEQYSFLKNSAAQVDTLVADGRMALAREQPHSFDIIVLDAFSGDAIPFHLLTKEAFEMYFDHLKEGGVVAVHVTNKYLDLSPVIIAAAKAMKKQAVAVHTLGDPKRELMEANWILVSDHLERLRLQNTAGPSTALSTVRLWTDDYSNLFQTLR